MRRQDSDLEKGCMCKLSRKVICGGQKHPPRETNIDGFEKQFIELSQFI
jgi:hypothetical protein